MKCPCGISQCTRLRQQIAQVRAVENWKIIKHREERVRPSTAESIHKKRTFPWTECFHVISCLNQHTWRAERMQTSRFDSRPLNRKAECFSRRIWTVRQRAARLPPTPNGGSIGKHFSTRKYDDQTSLPAPFVSLFLLTVWLVLHRPRIQNSRHGTLLGFDFDDAAWPDKTTKTTGGVTAAVEQKDVGTIDVAGSVKPRGGCFFL